MLYDPGLTWGDVQDEIEAVQNFYLNEDKEYLGKTVQQILDADPEEKVFKRGDSDE